MPIEKMAKHHKSNIRTGAFTLVEMLVIIVVFGFMVGIATVTLTGNADRVKFEKESSKFIHVLKLALNASVETSQAYAVVLDFEEGSYFMLPYTHADKDRTLEEEAIIAEGFFSENFWLDHILYDDGIDSRDLEGEFAQQNLWIRARRSGWENAAKIGVLDRNGNEYSIVLSRMSGDIKLIEGDAYLPGPREKRDVPF